MRALQSVATITLVVYLVIVAFAFIFANRLLFRPPAATYDTARLPIRFVTVGDDSIAVLHLSDPTARFTILYSHGNAEDLGGVSYRLGELHALGLNVIGYDYRGYGLSTTARTTARKAAADVDAVYDYVTQVLKIPPQNLILFGRSVGTGPTMELASRRPAAGVILQSPFMSAFRVVTGARILPFDKFPNLSHVRKLNTPLLVIHGMRDDIIPFAHGERVFEAAAQPKRSLWLEEAGHDDVPEAGGKRYTDAIRSFVQLVETGASKE